MKRNMFRNGFVLGIIFLITGVGVIPSTVGIIEKKLGVSGRTYGGHI
jgi:hypothetical protein